MFGSWTLDSFAIGSVILFAVPIIACIRTNGMRARPLDSEEAAAA